MYSIVLMAALTTGTDVPDFGRRGGCCGCYGGGRGWGGGYGCGGCYGGYGGWGGGYGGWGGGYGGWGGYAMTGRGGWGGWGGYVYAPPAPIYAAPVLAANMLPAAGPATRSMYYTPNTAAENRATIIVHLPDAASLTVNGKTTTSTSTTRRFYSPPLEPGKNYHYTFEARMQRDGKMVTADQEVDVSMGDRREITITMPDLDRAPDKDKGARDRQLQVNRR
jgi:uncharacterized protein (TIGR03000 family)